MEEIILKPEKDQHILIDKRILGLEVQEASLSNNDKVIEIGAGTGALTEELAKKSHVLAFENDKRFEKCLGPLEDKHSNLKIIYGNALSHDWKGHNKIVSNIPYSLCEPAVMKAVASGTEMLVLIVSEGFKDILFGESKMGIIARLFFDIRAICFVPKKCFYPEPRVDSWLVKLERKKSLAKIEKIMQAILLKEGKIKNAIIYALVENGQTKRGAREMISKMGLHESALEKSIKKISAQLITRLGKEIEKLI